MTNKHLKIGQKDTGTKDSVKNKVEVVEKPVFKLKETLKYVEKPEYREINKVIKVVKPEYIEQRMDIIVDKPEYVVNEVVEVIEKPVYDIQNKSNFSSVSAVICMISALLTVGFNPQVQAFAVEVYKWLSVNM
jgi:hypothetical protein